MRPLGIVPADRCCCPGHDKWPCAAYANNRSKRALSRSKRLSNRRARRVSQSKEEV
jgi:hypothetical protein